MTWRRHSAFCVLGAGALLALAGCFGPPAPAPTPSSAAPTASATQSAAPSATAGPTTSAGAPVTASPTVTEPPSSAPASPAPTASPPAGPAPTAEPTFTGFPEQVAPLTVYYVAVGDNGMSGPKIGCGDSLVATTTAPVRFTDQVGPSVGALLANKSREVGMSGLVNVLYQSNLTYLGGELNGSTISIWLSGQFMLGGVCDIPRAKAQLEYTAMAASAATSAQVFVNGRPIDEVLSLK
ncbi:hypothetical protein [Pseudarthrobacter sulfonivorans]|uniref:hypothetical protein n=1 Tax=Pseudarthrobacter sulfonivorans TaxID=121292 RepID=UPI0021076310|nr:hypothetical protein [Pseudarthrobacter sulfonivorans]